MLYFKGDKNMSFDVNDTIKKLDELEILALTPNEKGDINLALAVKIEELKAKFAQIKFEENNNKKYDLEVFVQNKRQKKLVDEI